MMCGKCCKVSGWIFLIVGILFLLVDLGRWAFWNIQWWTALFVVMGVMSIAKAGCKDCQSSAKKR